MICLLIENNIFDGLYKKIMDYDNDIQLKDFEWFQRDSFKRIFEKLLDDVYEKGPKSKYYLHYEQSNSVESYYRTIMKPELNIGLSELKEKNEKCIYDSSKSIFEPYSYSIFQDDHIREELVLHYFHKNENKNLYLERLGMFEITNEGDIFPFSFPLYDQSQTFWT